MYYNCKYVRKKRYINKKDHWQQVSHYLCFKMTLSKANTVK